MTKEYLVTMGRTAYLWGWPLVNARHRRASFAKAPEPGRLGGILPVAPIGHVSMLSDYVTPDQRWVAHPNQDVIYGFGYAAVDKSPVVIQVPDFGERYWVVALYDARSDEFSNLGRQYNTKPGFYLVVGPNWKGKVPDGITGVLHSPTDLVAMGPRIFMDDTANDRKAVQPVINRLMIYPLDEYTGKPQQKDWQNSTVFPAPKSASRSEIKWVDPATFFDELGTVLDEVPPLPGEEALYANFRALVDGAASNPDVKAVLEQVAIEAEDKLVKPLFAFSTNGVPVGNGWTTPVNGARFGYDYVTRTATAKSNMYVNQPEETRYFFAEFDGNAKRLNGKQRYTLTFPKGYQPPVNGFWSLTAYDADHFFSPNPLNRYSVGTKSPSLKYNGDGSLTIYIQSENPGGDTESNWLPTPEEDFSLTIRTYWPKPEVLEGLWLPPAIDSIMR